MDEPNSLDNLFEKKIFRIPDYKRGYAWQISQLKDFWEDLVNLPEGRSHYTGVLTLRQVPSEEIEETANEYWLVKSEGYDVYHVVDGQQRLTTFVVFLQALIDCVKYLDENAEKDDREIYIADRLSLNGVSEKFLYKTKSTGGHVHTYKFGYPVDNPSDGYLRHKFFNEDGEPSMEETFYTLNLRNAKCYFSERLNEIHAEQGIVGLENIYTTLTERFLFNEHVIKDEFDVFVAFETMNNRGKNLSDLELLKNRLIYLTTLYANEELDAASYKNLRNKINAAGIKVRNGYSDGSHSEIEVARYTDWTPKEIEERGLKLLSFMEERWDFKFIDDQKKDLLFLPTEASEDKD